MLEHESLQDATPSVRQTPLSQAPTPALSAERQAQVEACLDHLCSRASAGSTHQTPRELRAEMQARLEELVAARHELGSGLDTATVAALQQLRKAYATSIGIEQAKTRRTLFQKYPSLRPTLLPLSLFSTFYIADATKFAWHLWARIFGITIDGNGQVLGTTDAAQNGSATIEAVFYRFELFVVPLLVGLVTGFLLRSRAGRAVLNALALLAVFAILLPGFLYGLGISGILKDLPSWVQLPSFVPGTVGVTFWVAMGYSGAQLGNWLSRCGALLMRSTKKARRSAPRTLEC